ncbi:MAG: siderophore-interacting protein [Kocuria sp.]|nr:siderophore-interacting protein [Kocuria sp.]
MQRTSRQTTVYPITIRQLEVLRVHDVTPGMRRVVLGGPGLAEHERNGVTIPQFCSSGFDDDVKIIVPDPVTGLCPIPQPQPGGTVAWTEEAIALARTYTVRSFDADLGELAIDFVLHGTGLASSWLRRVTPGESVYLAGPKVSAAVPTDTDWMLLVGDDTALPAIARCLEDVPAGTRVRAVVEVPTEADRQSLHTQADLELTWVVRDAGEDLVETVKAIDWWDGEPFVWVAGEANAIKPLRRWFKQERSVPREHTDISGYWRQREVVSLENDMQTVDVAATGPSAEMRLHEMTELAPALAVRAACAMGIFPLVDDGVNTVADLASRTQTHEEALYRFVRLLICHDLLEVDSDGRLQLTEMGQLLSDPDSRMVRSLSQAATIAELSLSGVQEVLRAGNGPVAVDAHGRTWTQIRRAEPTLAAQADEYISEEAWFTAPALPGVLGLESEHSVTLTGSGAGVYADEAVRRIEGLRVVLAGSPEAVQRELREISPERQGSVTTSETTSGKITLTTDTVISIDPFGTMPREEHVTYLKHLVDHAQRVVVVSALVDESTLDEFDVEEDIRRLCLYGGELPSKRRLAQIAADAGGIVHKLTAVGWGLWAVELAATTTDHAD